MDIRSATQSEFQTAVRWATNEGWNPGLKDLEAFFKADPDGFLIGIIDGEIVGFISVVKYDNDYGFLGFYIVAPKFRGQGLGLQIWNAGMDYLKGRTIGLDGVVEQQDNYRKSGFSYAYKNTRFQGAAPDLSSMLKPAPEIQIRSILPDDYEQIFKLDRECFGVARDDFLRFWLTGAASEYRQSKVAIHDEKIVGFGAIRKCVEGFKTGPLFADDAMIAQELVGGLINEIPEQSVIILDVPEPNHDAVALAEQFELEPVFTTARMYCGTPKSVKIEKIFGITTFELG
ncbi:MAG: GNAT family N-acetyltransferase [Rhizobiaceae bacterium]|nr:GNAT family N-acetyltransferase [Rhizobiaceae bacterium]